MKKEVRNVEIQQTENGYILHIGLNCSLESCERYVFQSFCELVNFLNIHFTFRNEMILTDNNYQSAITLK